MPHLQRPLCDDREGSLPNEMLTTRMNSVPLVLQGQASLEPETNRPDKPHFCSGPSLGGAQAPRWSEEKRPVTSALRLGRNRGSEVLSGLALPWVALALPPPGSGVKRRYDPCALRDNNVVTQRVPWAQRGQGRNRQGHNEPSCPRRAQSLPGWGKMA